MSKETVKKLAIAIVREHVAQKTANGKALLEAQAKVRDLLHLEMRERIGRAIEQHRVRIRATTLNDAIGFGREEAIDETLWDAAKLVGKGIAKHIAPKTIRTIGNVVTAIRKKKKVKVSVSKVARTKATAAKTNPVHDTSPAKMDRHAFTKAHKAAGGQLHKIKL